MAKKIKKIPYGIADFELIRRYDYYYYSVPEVLHTLLTIYNPQVRHHNEPIFEAILLQYQEHIVLIRVPCGSQFHET
jgi:hypothetical protein